MSEHSPVDSACRRRESLDPKEARGFLSHQPRFAQKTPPYQHDICREPSPLAQDPDMEVAAGTAGFISLGIQVTQTLVNFYSAYKSQKSDVSYTIKKLEHLLGVLETLRRQLASRKFGTDEQGLLDTIEDSIRDCEECIQDLQAETEKLKSKSADGIQAAARTAAYRATYPFRQSTLQKLDEDIDEIVSHLSLALQVLEQKDLSQIQDNVEDTKALLDLVRADQVSWNTRQWLKAPDVTGDYYKACEKWHPGTGLWFVKGSSFSNWLTNRNSFLWLNGFAGCGKSVLCSTAIRHTYRHQRSNPRTGIAFFFFTFNDESKQDTSATLRALVLQLSAQLNDNYGLLSRLHGSYRDAMPPDQALIDCLRQLVRAFEDVYVLLDGLDESPRESHRGRLLEALTDFRAWSEPGLHILVTSREETDICEELEASPEETISLENESVDRDIATFVSNHLRENRRLRKWEPHYDQIQTALTERAKGVFRWVECQFAALESCPRCKRRLDKLLASLPRSLDKTYERMLMNIDEESVDDARRILNLLCCASRPLTVPEVIEGVAVELGDDPRLNPDGRLPDEDEIRRVCPGLIRFDMDPNRPWEPAVVRIAHFSVQEYLESGRMHDAISTFNVKRREAHAEIASVCLTYLLHPALSVDLNWDNWPLIHYAAKSWYKHYHDGNASLYQAEDQALQLFRNTGPAFETWVIMGDIDFFVGYSPPKGVPPVYYASLLGLESTLYGLLREPSFSKICPGTALTESCVDINIQGGYYGNALQAASANGYTNIVQLLLDKGADVYAQGGYYGNALQAASENGHTTIVQLLLDKGADVHAQGGEYGNALQAASSDGHEVIARLLMEKGADVNAQGGKHGTALQAASLNGHETIVQLLVKKGANVHTQGYGEYDSALQAASVCGHETIVRILLEKGAGPNAEGGEYHGGALQAASNGGHVAVVKRFLELGADPNVQTGRYRENALHKASMRGHKAVVQLLLESGADPNIRGTLLYDSAIQAASLGGHTLVVQLLLEYGADVNAQGGNWTNALQAATSHGHEAVVQILLENGVDIDSPNRESGSALQAALRRGHEGIAQLLLKNGADINAQGGHFRSVLQAAIVCGYETMALSFLEENAAVGVGANYSTAILQASSRGYEKIVRILLERGVDVNARADYGENALELASSGGHETIVRILLDHGANVTAEGSLGTALGAASQNGHEAIVRLLLEEGADVDATGEAGTPLESASGGGHEVIVRHLLERGADVNAERYYGTALLAASREGHEGTVQLLLEEGADVNVGNTFGTALKAASRGGHHAIVRMLRERGAIE